MTDSVRPFSSQFEQSAEKIFGKNGLETLRQIRNVLNDKTTLIPGGSADHVVSLDATGHIKDSGKSVPTGIIIGTSDIQTLTNKTLTSPIVSNLTAIRLVSSDANKVLQSVTDLTSWILETSGKITVTASAGGKATIDVSLKANAGLDNDANGIFVKLKPGFGIDVDSLGLKLKQQAHITDASAVSHISANSGSDQIDRTDFNSKLSDLVSEINAIKDKVNAILLANETAELYAAI